MARPRPLEFSGHKIYSRMIFGASKNGLFSYWPGYYKDTVFCGFPYTEGFLYLKGKKSRTTYFTWCRKSDPEGVGAIWNVTIFFSQGYPHQKVRKSQEIPGYDRLMIFLYKRFKGQIPPPPLPQVRINFKLERIFIHKLDDPDSIWK